MVVSIWHDVTFRHGPGGRGGDARGAPRCCRASSLNGRCRPRRSVRSFGRRAQEMETVPCFGGPLDGARVPRSFADGEGDGGERTGTIGFTVELDGRSYVYELVARAGDVGDPFRFLCRD